MALSLNQIALALEIGGFLLASLFGAIFLNREMFGRWFTSSDSGLVSLSDKLRKQYLSLAKYLEYPGVKEQISAALIRGGALVLVIVGWLNDISWLFWLGIFACSVYIIIIVVSLFIGVNEGKVIRKTHRWWMYPLNVITLIFVAFTITPIIATLFSVFVLLHGIFTILAIKIAEHSNGIRKTIIFIGSLLIFAGLLLEYIAVG